MKKIFFTITLFALTVITGFAQDVTGKWKTIDDETGEAKSIVEIYKQNGKVYGKVVEILDPKKNAILPASNVREAIKTNQFLDS